MAPAAALIDIAGTTESSAASRWTSSDRRLRGAGEIETALMGHMVVEVAVVGLADDDLSQRIVAYVVGDSVGAAVVIDRA